jgi:hypothetical protein
MHLALLTVVLQALDGRIHSAVSRAQGHRETATSETGGQASAGYETSILLF